ncbi:unnamed protein product [Owenia fusiformis]|uniref:Uncharacterized protein n=1 Tax=Owenia fusiformis TaxID=6347 RepID=A0A8J1TFH9_OWEFU|nr:unnamed protein product [Owenia fusiformis]
MENVTFNLSMDKINNFGNDRDISFTNISVTLFNSNFLKMTNAVLYSVFQLLLPNIVAGLGLIGNLLSFLVLSKEKVSNTRIFLLKTLTITDSTFLLLTIPFSVNGRHQIGDITFNVDISDFIYLLLPSLSAASTLTTWMVVLVTIDRYMHITKPIRVKTLLTVKRMKWTVGCLVVGACLYNVPRYFEWHHGDGTCLLSCNPSYNLIYNVILNATLRYFGPVFIVSILNVRLVKAIQNSQSKLKQMTCKEIEERNHGITMIAIVSVFMICSISSLVTEVTNMLSMYNIISLPIFKQIMMDTVSNFFLVCNSSFNFVIYFMIGKSFRKKLKQLFKGKNNNTPIH